jgi:protein involved in polysaccharide export with SLBB domain
MGRVISEFNPAKLANNPHLDILIEDQDQIVIPPLSSQVYLFGEFNDPGARRYNTSLSLQDYISSVGKLKKSSDKDLLIIGPDGTTTYYQSSRLSSIFSEEYEIYPGTIIYAPRSIGKVEGIQFASVVAPILSSLAISLASLNSINN